MAEVAVVGVPDDRWGERVHGVVVPAVGSALTEQDVVEHCRSMIAGYKVPKSVDVRTDPLPKSAQGRSSSVTSDGKCTPLRAHTDEEVIPPQGLSSQQTDIGVDAHHHCLPAATSVTLV